MAPVLVLAAIGLISLWSIPMAAGITAITVAAAVVRQVARGKSPVPGLGDLESTRRAHAVGRRELGDDTEGSGPIIIDTPFGAATADMLWQDASPVIRISHPLGELADMSFVIRRRRSAIGLPPVVENTPIPGASGEVRLRRMPLGAALDDYLEAGSSRPRLFRELLDLGLRDALTDLVDQPNLRLEDCTFTGDRLALLMQPAGDPTTQPWLQASVDVAGYLALGLHRFLASSVAESPQS